MRKVILAVAAILFGLSSCTDKNENKVFVANGVSFEMVKVDGGTFVMGATAEQIGDAEDEEYPAHNVTLNDYYIGRYLVTQDLWQAVMDTNPSNFVGGNLPVEMVSWIECQVFLDKLNLLLDSQLNGHSFALPTEAQWEFAARGGNRSKGFKYCGSDNLDEVAWFVENGDNQTHPVGLKKPNELGLYDMSGNVWEWCIDWYGPYGAEDQVNPKGAETGIKRVDRGGSWTKTPNYHRVSSRGNYCGPDYKCSSLGLRLVLN